MANSVYPVNKGINKSIEFKGLRAQYIWYLAIGILIMLILFGTMYAIGIPAFICVGLALIGGTVLVMKVYAMSAKYGEHGLTKELAKRNIPHVVRCNSRRIFRNLKRK
ncbi:MAG: DUF4133 domain-containing protein [Sphingobacterium sp.]|jgi:hypothetical protein|nr:DUF4133 domain-containing protein [Sphingobacterium sp.]